MKLTQKDWVQLSAFLDGELSCRDMEQLKARMAADPFLLSALEELRSTKHVLRNTPRLHVPRNFTLSPDQVGVKSKQPVYRIFRLATAVMSFLLIGVLILDFGVIFLGGASAPARAPMAEELVLEKAIEESQAEVMEEPALLAAEAEGESDRAAVDQEVPPVGETEGMAEEKVLPSSEAVETVTVEEALPALVEESPREAETPAGEDVSETETIAEAQDQANLSAPSPTAESLFKGTQSLSYSDETHTWEQPRRQVSPLRILEIIFGLGVIGFGIAAWVYKRRGIR